MKIRTSELTGHTLDWAVAKCEGREAFMHIDKNGELYSSDRDYFDYSTNWSQGGPIIEREGICSRFDKNDARGKWYAVMGKNRFLSPDFEGSGETLLIATMRCYVASKFGNEIEIPDELLI